MAGKRNQKRGRLDSLLGPSHTPEILALEEQMARRTREVLLAARANLKPAHRRWLSAFELEVRCYPDEDINFERVGEHMGCSAGQAAEALERLRCHIEEAVASDPVFDDE